MASVSGHRRPTGLHALPAHTTLCDGRWLPITPRHPRGPRARLARGRRKRVVPGTGPRQTSSGQSPTAPLPRYRHSLSLSHGDRSWRTTPKIGPEAGPPRAKGPSCASSESSLGPRRTASDLDLLRAVRMLQRGCVAVGPPPPPRAVADFTFSDTTLERCGSYDECPAATSSPRSTAIALSCTRARASPLLRQWAAGAHQPDVGGRDRPSSARAPLCSSEAGAALPRPATARPSATTPKRSESWRGSVKGPLAVMWAAAAQVEAPKPPPLRVVASPPASAAADDAGLPLCTPAGPPLLRDSFQGGPTSPPAGREVSGFVSCGSGFRSLRGRELRAVLQPVPPRTPQTPSPRSPRGSGPHPARRQTPPAGTVGNLTLDYSRMAHSDEVQNAARRLPECAAAAHSVFPSRFMKQAGERDGRKRAEQWCNALCKTPIPERREGSVVSVLQQ
eukprot:TRINITY_DN10646_c0_g1_i1.p1 TRINITY_DN10646_c0_g1~~TRINITY_DN10646_c0_g1_i1.p1  ORF type:complete len:480 (+),score=113.09 TRINITY_DN10646_c0_g1_i1:99-1442(+)